LGLFCFVLVRYIRVKIPILIEDMSLRVINLIASAFSLVYSVFTLAATEANQNICAQLAPLLADSVAKTINPSRYLNNLEQEILDKANLDLLEHHYYSDGAMIVDVDDDSVDDLLVWNVEGSGRYTNAEVYALAEGSLQDGKDLILKFSLDLGVLRDPQLVRFEGHNYFVYTDTGDSDGLLVSRIKRITDNKYEKQNVCFMQTIAKADTTCRHPACRKLRELIQDNDNNALFINVAWPHKYLPPAGLEVFYSSGWSTGDFDNSGKESVISRFGRRGYIYQDIYWSLLGLDVNESQIDPSLQPKEDSVTMKSVLPNEQHDRLRNTLDQQSKVLSVELKRKVKLPESGEFFLFNANKGRTYWAWDFDEAPYGRDLHIVYSNSKKSDYIGSLKVSRDQQLKPCKSQCNTSLNE